jgi:hypothetical protein
VIAEPASRCPAQTNPPPTVYEWYSMQRVLSCSGADNQPKPTCTPSLPPLLLPAHSLATWARISLRRRSQTGEPKRFLGGRLFGAHLVSF